MEVGAAMHLYLALAAGVFRTDLWSPFRLLGGGWYNEDRLEAVLRDHLVAPFLPAAAGVAPPAVNHTLMGSLNRPDLHVVMTTTRLGAQAPDAGVLISSDTDAAVPIVQALRMTSAAPAFFRPVYVQGQRYIDGGVGNNNPGAVFARRVTLPLAPANRKAPLGLFLSVGTGMPPQAPPRAFDFWRALLNHCIDDATQTDMRFAEAEEIFKLRHHERNFWEMHCIRLQPPLARDIPLHETNPATLHALSQLPWAGGPITPAQIAASLLAPDVE
jgi:hypothetical protein